MLSRVVVIVLALIASFTSSEGERAPRYTASWAVEVREGREVADKLASKHRFENLGPVGNLRNIYHFIDLDPDVENDGEGRSVVKASHTKLRLELQVGLVEQQFVQRREKKRYSPPTDPEWNNQWYLLNTGQNGPPGFDLNVEPVWLQGVTGCNVVVAIVDDGVEHTHPDLAGNYVTSLGYDYADFDSDPFPFSLVFTRDSHGTSCAGEIAMVKDNNKCGVGVAYRSSITGVRLLGPMGMTDMQEAEAIAHNSDIIEVYSNSWGVPDSGREVGGPGPLFQRALETGVREGRNGKGSIYVFAAGNGGRVGDTCAADGYPSSIYTIGIGSVDSAGAQASYDENCSGKLAVTFVSDPVTSVSTTSEFSGCTDSFDGTSAATPLASAAIALALEVNPSLTWRDVQYLIAYTSNSEILTAGEWQTNGAGLNVSHKFGFGAIDAEAMVTRARHWISVPEQQSDTVIPTPNSAHFATSSNPLSITFVFNNNGGGVRFLEHVVVIATLSTFVFDDRGDIQLELTSPMGTLSLLLPYRSSDSGSGSYTNWPFQSVHYWGENPNGVWTLTVRYRDTFGSASVTGLSVTLYGTTEIPQAVQRIPSQCDSVCAPNRGCADIGPQFCDACRNLRNAETLECIDQCPDGFTERNNYCYNATLPEPECMRRFNATVTTGMCSAAEHTACCVTGECRAPNAQCFCDVTCYSLGDCCGDIQDSCPQPPEIFLEFLDLNTASVLPQEDDVISNVINIPGGLQIGSSIHDVAYVSTNGYISLGDSFNECCPGAVGDDVAVVGPFWADTDISDGVGRVSYEVHTGSSTLLSEVNSFISSYQRVSFSGSWMLVAEWREVPPYTSGIRMTEDRNTFQGLLITSGNQSYAVFIYECGSMEWSEWDGGKAAIGFLNAADQFYQLHRLSRSPSAHNISCLNSPTLWTTVVYDLGGGTEHSPESDDNLSTAAIVGIAVGAAAVGAIVIIIAMVALAMFCICTHYSAKKRKTVPSDISLKHAKA